DGSVFQASNTFTGLAAGNYTAWVRNASLNSCSASSSVSIADPEACGPPECTNPTNLALNKPSSQSSTRGQGVASFVNDGNTTGNDNWGSDADMHHTENGDNQLWWKVDLGEVATLSRVDIFNRTTTNSGLLSRLTDFYIFISAFDIDGTRSLSDLAADPIIANEFFTGAAGAFESINLDQAQGRYIMIRLSGSGPLHMAEVEVYGCSNSGNASPANPLREAFQPVEGDQLEEFLWKISPNPFKESFTVEVYSELKENTFVELYNALGQRVGYYRMPESKRLSLSPRFAEGIYFMYLIVGEQTYQGKIIKAR
ncbi:MAG: T9SS type A sorting domain-containing protein, partial [Bacteroidota bacterium]